MFTFRNRSSYNDAVDVKLNNEFGIKTENNPHFPEIPRYRELVDAFWTNNCSEDECALQIGVLYTCCLFRHGLSEEAGTLAMRIAQIGQFGVQRRLVRQQILEKCATVADIAAREMRPAVEETESPEGITVTSDAE